MRRPSRIAALALVLALALPSAALAQSAGDEQYTDPFAGEQESGSQQQDSGAGSQGGDGESSTPPAGQGQTAAPAASSAQAPAAQTGALPRTGSPTPLLLAYGGVLLIAGTALRRMARRAS